MSPQEHRRARGRGAITGIVLLMVAGALGAVPPPAAAQTPTHARTEAACPDGGARFGPTQARIPGIVGSTRVLARGQDSQGTPLPPPLTNRGKWRFAWDKRSVRPGDSHGVVRLTAHTYPWHGSKGRALGNRLLSRLRVGALIELSGNRGQRLCYRVVQHVRVRADRRPLAFYSLSGAARLGILVCSGKRRGPGNWSHRTIWVAKPITQG